MPGAGSMQPEKHLLLGCESGGDGRIKRIDDRRGELEVADDDGGEFGIESGLRGQRALQVPIGGSGSDRGPDDRRESPSAGG